MQERAALVNGAISRGGTRLVQVNHPTDTADGHYYGNFLGWNARSRYLQDIIEVRGGTRYVDQVCKVTEFLDKLL